MESLEIAVAVIVKIFQWIFKSLGGQRVAAILATLSFPVIFFSALANSNLYGMESMIILTPFSLLTVVSIYAIWQTRFFTVPLSSFTTFVNTAGWITIIAGYMILILVFGVFILTVMILAAVMAAFSDSFGLSSRR
jgi:hypothetical protein